VEPDDGLRAVERSGEITKAGNPVRLDSKAGDLPGLRSWEDEGGRGTADHPPPRFDGGWPQRAMPPPRMLGLVEEIVREDLFDVLASPLIAVLLARRKPLHHP
jgi:hypothetical protein